MKYILSYFTALLLGSLIFFGCAETKDDLTQPQEVNIHGEGTLNPTSENFHSFLVRDEGLSDCQRCHAADFSGGPTEANCASAGCHPTIGVHIEGINNPGSDAFHGKYIADNNAFFECAQCHGEEFTGGVASPTCVDCHNGIGVHMEGINNPSAEAFHGNFIRTNDWNLEQCGQCHGENYSGGLASSTCLTCHNHDGGPEAWNTCHGDFSNPEMTAPPQGTNNETETTAAAVGAHQKHLFDIVIAQNTACEECHIVPDEFEAQGHIDATIGAELVFGQFTNSGPSEASYNNLSCQNTYCHGNFEFLRDESASPFGYADEKIVGNNYSPIWNLVDGTQAACGTCHGEIDNTGQLITPLPTGHSGTWGLESCANCHFGVVDSEGNIIDPAKHINGTANVFGN